jgi:hypothetical protein
MYNVIPCIAVANNNNNNNNNNKGTSVPVTSREGP